MRTLKPLGKKELVNPKDVLGGVTEAKFEPVSIPLGVTAELGEGLSDLEKEVVFGIANANYEGVPHSAVNSFYHGNKLWEPQGVAMVCYEALCKLSHNFPTPDQMREDEEGELFGKFFDVLGDRRRETHHLFRFCTAFEY